MKLNDKQYRQGDVLVEMIEDLPPSMVALKPDADGSATLAHGEVTGHRHRFEFMALADGSAASVLYANPDVPMEPAVVRLLAPQALVHEEHHTHQIPAGVGRISRPYEYVGPELLRRVED